MRRVCEACWARPAESERLRRCRSCRRHGRQPSEKFGARILFLDIETSPNIVYTWGLWNQNIGLNQIIEAGRMLCWAAKWRGDPGTLFLSEQQGRQQMVEGIWRLLDEADMVVHYYGSRFDIPWLNRTFLEHGLTPPRPFRQVDLKQVVSKRFKFPSNKLDYVAQTLGLGGKVKHEGFDLWRACLDGDQDAWARMEEYNRHDVVLTEEIYEVLLPWIPGHPNLVLYDDGAGCPTCGGVLEDAGLYRTRLSVFRQYRCSSCGAYARDSRRIDGADVQEAIL